MVLRAKLKQSDDIQNKIDGSGLETLNYDRSGRNRLRLTQNDPKQHADLLRELIGLAHGNRTE
jgi:hypothetical protein